AEGQVDDGDFAGGVDEGPFAAGAGLGEEPEAAVVGQGGSERVQDGFGGGVGSAGGDAGAGQSAAHGGQALGQGVRRPGRNAVSADTGQPGVGQGADGGVVTGFELPGGMFGAVAPGAARGGGEAGADGDVGSPRQLRQAVAVQPAQRFAS
ncbi:hypothetical protein OY671_012450, partial [Metschnikowia pulcherrima]